MNSHHTLYKSKPQYQEGDEINFSKTNLFFIKSKHVFKHYKNHDYFEIKAQNRHKTPESKQFVAYPTPFGINNAYKYLCEQIANKNIKPIKINHQKLHTEGENLLKNNKKSIIFQRKSRPHYTLPNLSENPAKIQANSYTKEGSGFLNTQKRLSDSKDREGHEMIDMIFVQKGKFIDRQEKIIRYEVKLNIYNHIISTFIKSRINYNELTYEQFSFIKQNIINIYEQQRENIQYKDIVNLKYVKDIFKLIQQRNDPLFTKETLRYFFVSSLQIYEYQLNKIKDQIKSLINYQFQQEINQQEIYIYSLQGNEITNLYEIMNHNQQPFICGTHKNVYQIYEKQEKQKNSKRSMINRINKWKNAIPSSQHQQNYNKISNSIVNDQKYNILFESVKKKHGRNLNNNKKRSAISLKTSQFIDKDKLCKDQNIFQ